MSNIANNSKEERNKAQQALDKGKEVQKQLVEKGHKWVKTFRGFKLVKE